MAGPCFEIEFSFTPCSIIIWKAVMRSESSGRNYIDICAALRIGSVI